MTATIQEQIQATLTEIHGNATRLGQIAYDLGDGEDARVEQQQAASVAELELVAKTVHTESVRAVLLLLATVSLTGKLRAMTAQLKEAGTP